MRCDVTPLVSVVIVNYNGGALLSAAVASTLASSVSVEVIVSDNGSSDRSVELLRQHFGSDQRLHVIENGTNLGFSKANNRAIEQARGDYVLLQNPDCLLAPDNLERMTCALAACPDAGMAGCLIRNPDGSEQQGCRRSLPTPWRAIVQVLYLDGLFPKIPLFRSFVQTKTPSPEQSVFLDAISGAYMLVRRDALVQVGPLDEDYFLHCDDLDWCMRFSQAGWRILFVPDVEVVHYKGACSRNRPVWVEWHKHKSMVRFYLKFFRHQYPLLLTIVVVHAVWTRFAAVAARIVCKRLLGHYSQHTAPNLDFVSSITATHDRRTTSTPPLTSPTNAAAGSIKD